MLHAQAAPTAVAVPELLAQLESTEKELDKLKVSYEILCCLSAFGVLTIRDILNETVCVECARESRSQTNFVAGN